MFSTTPSAPPGQRIHFMGPFHLTTLGWPGWPYSWSYHWRDGLMSCTLYRMLTHSGTGSTLSV